MPKDFEELKRGGLDVPAKAQVQVVRSAAIDAFKEGRAG